MSDDTSPAALLTNSQREFLRTGATGENPAHDRAMLSRIRKRVYGGLLDGSVLWALPVEERKKIFRQWEEAGEEFEPGSKLGWMFRQWPEHGEELTIADELEEIFREWDETGKKPDVTETLDGNTAKYGLDDEFDHAGERAREQFTRSLTSLVAFIYHGLTVSDTHSPAEVITAGVEHAERALGNDVRAELNMSERFNTEALLERFEAGDPKLTHREIQHLREEAGIDGDDLDAYYGRMRVDPRDVEWSGSSNELSPDDEE